MQQLSCQVKMTDQNLRGHLVQYGMYFSAPVIEILVPAVREEVNSWNRLGYQYDLLHALACVIAHELGHTILWHIDHNEQVQNGEDEISILTNGDGGHHVYGQHRMKCFMWPYFPPGVVPDLDNDGALDSLPFPNLPTDFCDNDHGCQNLWCRICAVGWRT